MEGMEEKMAAVLGNPQLMQQIMSMAQSLGTGSDMPQPAAQAQSPGMDMNPELIKSIMGLAGKIGTDSNQQALLCALRPYLSEGRIGKLERAMRAAKLASLASAAFSSGALSFLTGR